MVQSVITSNSNKSQASSSAVQAIDVESDQQGLDGSESKTLFSDALETAIADEEKACTANEEQIIEDRKLQLNNEVASNIADDQIEFELTTQRPQDEDKVESDDLQFENIDTESPIIEEHTEDIAFSTTEQNNESTLDSDKEMPAEDNTLIVDAQNPPAILAQIEAAQKIDTEVTESQKPSLSINENASVLNLSQTDKSKGLKADIIVNKEIDLALKPDAGQISEVDFYETLQKVEKDKSALFVNSNLTDENTLTQGSDLSGQRQISINSVNMQQANSNTQAAAQTQNSLLQQPLDMQAKHASTLLGERVLMMINQGKQEVQIRLDPAELGSMHIKLHIHHDQVQLAIHTQVGESRDIIEQNLPRLREQLAQQGVNLGETNVTQQHNTSQQNSHDQSENNDQESAAFFTDDSSLSIMEDKTEWLASKMVLSDQVIDYYA